MSNTQRIPQAIWEIAKSQAIKVLIDVARSKNPSISYSELVGKIFALQIEAHGTLLGELLGEISSEEDSKGHGLLTVLVVHKSGDGMPGGQFFELAKSRGHKFTDRTKFWLDELEKVCTYWQNQSDTT